MTLSEFKVTRALHACLRTLKTGTAQLLALVAVVLLAAGLAFGTEAMIVTTTGTGAPGSVPENP